MPSAIINLIQTDSSLESDTDNDEADVRSYPLVYDDTNEDHIETTPYASVYEIVNWHLDTNKIPNYSKVEAQTISCVVKPLGKQEANLEIMAQSNTTGVFNQAIPAFMTKKQCRHYSGLVYQNVLVSVVKEKSKILSCNKVHSAV